MPCVENLVSYCFVLFVLIHVDSTRVKLIIIVLYTDKLAKKMKIKKENYGPYDDDTVNGEKQPEEVKSDGGVKIKDEDTDNETDNDTQPSQVESNDKIKKENYGPYDDDTVNGVEQLEEVKSNNLDVKIEEEETDIE